MLADKAYEAIQRHAFDPYRKFCEKRKEHAALMPLGARETFITEIEMLHAAHEQLWPIKDNEGIANLLSEIDLALMILEEIIEKAPAFEEF